MSFLRKYFRKNEISQAFNKRVYSTDDFDDTFTVVLKTLGWLAVRIAKNDSKTMTLIYRKIFCVEFVYMIMSIIMPLLKIIETVPVRSGSVDNYAEVFKLIPLIGIVLVVLVKAQQIYTYAPVYEDLINQLRNLFPQGQVSEAEHNVISKSLNQIRLTIKGCCGFHTFTGLAFMVPGILGIIARAFGIDVPKELPFLYWYPFDPTQPIVFELILFVQGSFTWISLAFSCCADLLFFILTSHIAIQLSLLAIKIRRMIVVPVDEQLVSSYPLGVITAEEKKLDNEDTGNSRHEKIVEIIKRHCDILRVAGYLERIVGFSLLFNFLNGTIIICFAGFCGFVVDDITVLRYKVLVILPLSQLWLICWYGQKLLDASAEVTNALYDCGWYMASNNIKSCVHLMIYRSQSNVYVTTYSFSIVCLASYTTIIKSSWSYLTLLLNTYQE